MKNSSQRRVVSACGLVGALALSACGSDSGPAAATLPPPTAISVMAETGDAGRLLTEMYAQALEAQGFRISRRDPAPDLETALRRLTDGEADLIITFTDELYTQINAGSPTPATFVAGANLTDQINAIGEVLDEKLLALAPATAQRGGFIACTKTVADEKPFTKLSELTRFADTLKLGATTEYVAGGVFSAESLTSVYGTEFKETTTLTPEEINTKLTAAEIDCGTFAAVDGTLPEKMVAVTDDRAFVPRDAVVPVVLKSTSQPGVNDILNSVSQALSTDIFISLMGSVVTGGNSPEVVAGTFLQAAGIAQKNSD